ncbi:MAG TPA: hypothetical protein PLU52_10035 [Opitutaceae bacterium]|nr:hypothetical protein [Opitutaceae bacterium]HND60689.1 hypothetical protein [Opitutaceae bacterium]
MSPLLSPHWTRIGGVAWLLLGLAAVAGPGAVRAAEPAPDAWTALSLQLGERQLFLDDFVLGDLDGVTRVIHSPRKYEHNPVIAPDRPTDGTTIQSRDAPSWDEQEQVWKIWYIRFGDDGNGAGGAGFARSKDGLHWEKPVLGLVESHGSRQNNLVVVQGDPKAFVQHVMIDPQAPPARRYKGLIGPNGRQPIVSADGFTFTRLDVPPIPSEDESQLNWDPAGRQFVLTVKHPGPFGRSVYLSLSPDFEHWTKPALIYHADSEDQRLGAEYIRTIEDDARYWRPTENHPHEYNVEIYNMAVFRYEGLYIGLPNYFESSGRIPPPRGNQDGINSPKLSCSRDLRAWTRVGDRAHFLPISPLGPGVVDTGQVMASSHPVRHGDELWFYYSGIDVRHRPNVPRVIDEYHGGICLAKLRIDGFVSLHAGAEGGAFDTRPVVLDGGRLCVNASAPGELRVELTSRDGRDPLPGWEAGACVPITGDHTRMEVQWPGRKLSELQGRAVRIRFHLKDADLYSFWLEP